MEPIMMYRLGQIRQQEILESVQRNRQGYAVTGLIISLWQRLFSAVSARNERSRAPQAVARVERGDTFATSQ